MGLDCVYDPAACKGEALDEAHRVYSLVLSGFSPAAARRAAGLVSRLLPRLTPEGFLRSVLERSGARPLAEPRRVYEEGEPFLDEWYALPVNEEDGERLLLACPIGRRGGCTWGELVELRIAGGARGVLLYLEDRTLEVAHQALPGAPLPRLIGGWLLHKGRARGLGRNPCPKIGRGQEYMSAREPSPYGGLHHLLPKMAGCPCDRAERACAALAVASQVARSLLRLHAAPGGEARICGSRQKFPALYAGYLHPSVLVVTHEGGVRLRGLHGMLSDTGILSLGEEEGPVYTLGPFHGGRIVAYWGRARSRIYQEHPRAFASLADCAAQIGLLAHLLSLLAAGRGLPEVILRSPRRPSSVEAAQVFAEEVTRHLEIVYDALSVPAAPPRIVAAPRPELQSRKLPGDTPASLVVQAGGAETPCGDEAVLTLLVQVWRDLARAEIHCPPI